MTSLPSPVDGAGTPHQTIPAPARIAAWLTKSGAPVMPPDPPTTSSGARHLFVSSGRALASSAVRVSASSSTCSLGVPTSMPMSATATAPACVCPGSKSTPGFRAAKVTVATACTAMPSVAPVWPSTPDGMSTATVSCAALAAAMSAATPSRRPLNPVPYIASDEHVGPGECPADRGGRGRRGELDDVDACPPPGEDRGGDQPVAAVVALAAHDRGAPTVEPVELAPDLPGDGSPGTVHERRLGRPGRDRASVGLGHLGRGEHRLHDSAHGDRDRQRGGVRVGQREVPRDDAVLVGQVGGPAVQRDPRGAAALADDLDVAAA